TDDVVFSQQPCRKRDGGEEREAGGVCWDNWIEAIRRRKEGNSEIRGEVDDGKTDAGRGGGSETRGRQAVVEETGSSLRRGTWLQPLPWRP
ncbi:unnamed protein product, partial [Tetraodon nigroviridis]